MECVRDPLSLGNLEPVEWIKVWSRAPVSWVVWVAVLKHCPVMRSKLLADLFIFASFIAWLKIAARGGI